MSENPLVKLIELEELDTNLFRGQNFPAQWGQVFGGQVLAQALNAARRTVPEDRLLHSMHSYFILPGRLDTPIIYQVDTIRDGRSFTTRRVVAFQKGKAIFNSAASFQVREEGFVHQTAMPQVTSYQELVTDIAWAQENIQYVPDFLKQFLVNRHIEFRPVEKRNWANPEKSPTLRHIWIKTEEALTDHPAFHREVLAFASDYHLMSTSLLPHLGDFKPQQMQMASLDHAMWFHENFRADQWLLFVIDSPKASNARGLNRGSFFNEEGVLVASVAQEGLIRKRNLTS